MIITEKRLCVIIRSMNKIIFRTAMILLAVELAVMIISILSRPLSDLYLRVWGIAVILTAAVAIYGLIKKIIEGKKER